MQIQIGSGPSAPDYAKHLCDPDALVITRKLNAPSELNCKLLIRGLDVVAPAVGQEISVLRATSEKLFTGVIQSVDHEYRGWGTEGPVYSLEVKAKSSELFAGEASAPGSMSQSAAVSAAEMLGAQMPGLPFAAGENGTAGLIALPAIVVGAGESVAAVLAKASDQGRLAYRVHDGALVVNELGAVRLSAPDSAVSAFAAAGKNVRIVAEGAMEAQDYATEYVVCDGSSALIPLGGSVFGAERRVLFSETFDSVTKLQVTGAAVTPGLLRTDPTRACDVRIGTAVEVGARLLFELGRVSVRSAGSAALAGFIAGAATVGNCAAGFQISAGPSGTQISAVIGGAATGAPLLLKGTSTYTLRVRIFVPEHLRRTQVTRGFTGTRGGREIPSCATVHCEVVEEGGSSVMAPVLATGTVTACPVSASPVVFSGGPLDASVTSVKLVSGPAIEVDYTPSAGVMRALRVGAKSDGAEAWMSKGEVKLGWTPSRGDVVRVRYRQGGRASAQGGAAGTGADALAVRLEAPLMRSTEDCENAIAMLLSDASNDAANVSGEIRDAVGSLGTNVWPGDALVSGGTGAIIREIKINPISVSADVFGMALKFANDAASPIAIKAVKSSSVVSPRGEAGAEYAENLSNVQIVSGTASSVQVDCGALQTGGHVEARSSPEGWGSTAGLVATSMTPAFSLSGDVANGEWFLKQVDASGNYSRETAIVRTSL